MSDRYTKDDTIMASARNDYIRNSHDFTCPLKFLGSRSSWRQRRLYEATQHEIAGVPKANPQRFFSENYNG